MAVFVGRDPWTSHERPPFPWRGSKVPIQEERESKREAQAPCPTVSRGLQQD